MITKYLLFLKIDCRRRSELIIKFLLRVEFERVKYIFKINCFKKKKLSLLVLLFYSSKISSSNAAVAHSFINKYSNFSSFLSFVYCY